MPKTPPLVARFCLRLRRFSLLLSCCLALLVCVAGAQTTGGDRQRGNRPRVNREQMWPAPTAEDWKRPVLIQWQRTWEDAVAIAKETGKPILICVNMDGEIASEHYAGIRYREPEKAALYNPYVTVVASVYRHSPRDYDEHGRRILCPRFGTVTCGDHMSIEPFLYENFFDGRRIAPRHIMVELDDKETYKETYDVFYTWDTDSVFNAIRDGIAKRTARPRTVVRGDRTIVERVASRDSLDRVAVETAYQKGDRAQRRRLLEAALAHIDAAPDDLLRLAVFGFDTDQTKLARRALARSDSTSSVAVINEALRVPMDATEREALIAALKRLGKSSRHARALAVIHRGLGTRSTTVDVDGWSKGLAGAEYPAPTERVDLLTQLESKAEASEGKPTDAAAQLEVAEANLALATHPGSSRRPFGSRLVRNRARLLFEDARTAALEAEKLGATGWRVDSVIAIAARHLGDTKEAYARAEAAVKNMPKQGDPGWNAMATLEIFVEGRRRAMRRAWRENRDWPAQWVADVNSAYAVLMRHPLGTASQVVTHYDFLEWLGAVGPAGRCLDEGLARFPESWFLHDRLRSRILAERGVDGLEPAYEAMLGKKDASKNLEWFAGLTSIIAAEFHRREGNPDKALAAYDRAIAHYERGIAANPNTRPTADHYIAIALAGRARLAYERGDHERALTELLASLERRPPAAATLDGLNISAVGTSRLLQARLKELKLGELTAKLDAALAKLDPELLELPAYEREGRGRNRGRRGQRRGQRRGERRRRDR